MSEDKQKHLLILSGPMGSGHVRAAKALEEWGKQKYPELKITNINVEEYMSSFIKFIYVRLYIIFNNHFPFLWSLVYFQTDTPPGDSYMESFLNWVRRRSSKRIVKMILNQNADYIICTHYLPAELLNRLKKSGKITCPVSSVVTDFSLHWIYLQPHIDRFFVASNELKFRLTEYGIEKDRIHITGIPVLPEFAQEFSREQLQKMKKELGLPKHDNIILLMMGGESKDKLTNLAKILVKRFPDLAFVVLPGKNKHALEKLQELQKDYPDQVFPVGFTNEVWKYMAVSMLVISKPGGISTSECIAMKKPMIIMYPIPGQEERNADYLLERSIVIKAYDEISLLYKDVLFTEDRRRYMLEQIAKVRNPQAGWDILEISMLGSTEELILTTSGKSPSALNVKAADSEETDDKEKKKK